MTIRILKNILPRNIFIMVKVFFYGIQETELFDYYFILYDDITKYPVINSLMQRQKTRKSEHAIGFKIFKCDLSTKRLTANDIRTNRSVMTHFYKHIF